MNPVAAQLRDAPVPKEACNFLKKQRELFEERRKKQADAIDFLHQFRADDDFVLRSVRRSLVSKNNNYSTTPNSTRRYKLEPRQQPDARAFVYSYALYPKLDQTRLSSKIKHDDISNESLSLQSHTNPPEIIKNSISFEYAFEALELAAKEASRYPLPDDSDVENGDDNEYFAASTEPLDDLVECTDQISTHSTMAQSSLPGTAINNDCGNNGKCGVSTAEMEHEKCNSILIVEGIDDFVVPSRKSDCDVAADSSAPFIPFEAFSKLGESLVLQSQNITLPKHRDVFIPSAESDSDDESIIPGQSFMQLGASMMANDLSSSKDDDTASIMIVNEPKQYTMENSNLMSKTATDVTASQVSICSKSLAANAGITDQTNEKTPKPMVQECFDNIQKQKTYERILDTEVILGDGVFESIVTLKRSNRNDLRCENGGANFVDGISGEEEKAVENKIHQYALGRANNDANCVDRISGEEEKVEENETQTKPNIEVAIPNSIGDQPRNVSRNGTMKKKKKDKVYYPSSSLFVSRQFFSR